MNTILLASPSVIFIIFTLYRIDKNKEPKKLLLKLFFGGIGAAIATLIVLFPFNNSLHTNGLFNSFFTAFFKASIPEESLKLFFLYLITRKTLEFDEYFDGILYAVIVSLGFAFFENILYILDGGTSVAIFRGIFSIPGHALFGVVMGYFYSLYKFEYNKKYLALTLVVPILFHGIYDFLVMYADYLSNAMSLIIYLIFIIFNIFLWKYALKKIKSHSNR